MHCASCVGPHLDLWSTLRAAAGNPRNLPAPQPSHSRAPEQCPPDRMPQGKSQAPPDRPPGRYRSCWASPIPLHLASGLPAPHRPSAWMPPTRLREDGSPTARFASGEQHGLPPRAHGTRRRYRGTRIQFLPVIRPAWSVRTSRCRACGRDCRNRARGPVSLLHGALVVLRRTAERRNLQGSRRCEGWCRTAPQRTTAAARLGRHSRLLCRTLLAPIGVEGHQTAIGVGLSPPTPSRREKDRTPNARRVRRLGQLPLLPATARRTCLCTPHQPFL